MKWFYGILLTIILISCKQETSTPEVILPETNPISRSFNEPIDFDKIRFHHLTEVFNYTASKMELDLNEVYGIEPEQRTFQNTIKRLDKISADFYGSFYLMSILSSLHPDEQIKEISGDYLIELIELSNRIYFSDDYYSAIKEYSELPGVKSLSASESKYLGDILKSFKVNGLGLPNGERDKIRLLEDSISVTGNQFLVNIEDSNDEIGLTQDDLEGLSKAFSSQLRKEGEYYYMPISYSMYHDYMRDAKSEVAREKVFRSFAKTNVEENTQLLSNMLKMRRQLAKLLGYKNYAEYRLDNHQVKSTQNVWNFLNDLRQSIQNKALGDYSELLSIQNQFSTSENTGKLDLWNKKYYENILLKTKYDLDMVSISEYFEVFAVIDGVLEIVEELYDVEILEVENSSRWHQDVAMYEIRENGRTQSYIYLDLFSRTNKTEGEFAIPITFSEKRKEGMVVPSIAIIANFLPPTKAQPTSLSHDQVVNLFRLFGVAIQHNFGKVELFSQNVFFSDNDFSYAPGNMFSNWAWEYNVVKRFAKHYRTGEILKKSEFNKLLKARNVGVGLETSNQVLFSAVDLTLHETFDPDNDSISIAEVTANLENTMSLFPHVDGTNFETSFSHLYDYGANYFTYLYSDVYARDLFSIFEKEGVFNPETGKKFKRQVLEKGISEDEYKLIVKFLGREPNTEAYIKSFQSLN